MALLDTRSRAGYLLLAAIVGHVLLISAQVNAKSGVPILEAVTFGAFSDVQRGTSAVASSMRRMWNDYVALRGLRLETESLKRQLAEAQIQLQEQRALADRSRGLAQMLELRDRVNLKTTAAEIIGVGVSTTSTSSRLEKSTAGVIRICRYAPPFFCTRSTWPMMNPFG